MRRYLYIIHRGSTEYKNALAITGNKLIISEFRDYYLIAHKYLNHITMVTTIHTGSITLIDRNTCTLHYPFNREIFTALTHKI